VYFVVAIPPRPEGGRKEITLTTASKNPINTITILGYAGYNTAGTMAAISRITNKQPCGIICQTETGFQEIKG
jgi:hypothetical protein